MDVEKFVQHLCRLVLRHQMPVWNYFVNSFYSVRYDAYSGTPHSAIYQAKPIKILKSKHGAPHSAMKSIAD